MSTWVLTVYGELVANLPTGMADEWEQTLKAERARILSGLLNKIPSEAEYQDKLADQSSDRYADFLTTVGAEWDATEIELKQRVKLARKYTAWDDGVDTAFAEGGTFETNVTSKKGKLEASRYVLGLVGNKSQDRWRCASLVALALGGDTRILRYITSPDTFTGDLEPAIEAGLVKFIRPMVVAMIVKYGVLAKYADEAGLTTERDAFVTSLNTALDLIEGHVIVGDTLTITASWDGTYDHIKIIVDFTAA